MVLSMLLPVKCHILGYFFTYFVCHAVYVTAMCFKDIPSCIFVVTVEAYINGSHFIVCSVVSVDVRLWTFDELVAILTLSKILGNVDE